MASIAVARFRGRRVGLGDAVATTTPCTLKLVVGSVRHWCFISTTNLCQEIGSRNRVNDISHNEYPPDLISCHGLVVDIECCSLMDTTTSLRVQVVVATASPRPALLPQKPATPMEAIVSEFSAVTQPCVANTPMKHNVTHHITQVEGQGTCAVGLDGDCELPAG